MRGRLLLIRLPLEVVKQAQEEAKVISYEGAWNYLKPSLVSPKLPGHTRLMGVHIEHEADGGYVRFKVQNPTLPQVPDGERIPEVDGEV